MSRFGRWRISGPRIIQKLPRRLLMVALATLAGLLLLGLIVQMDLTVSLEGKTRPENWNEIRAGREGTVAVIYVETGEWVDSGALLGELFNKAEKEAVVMAERRLTSLEAERDQIAAQLRLAEARYRTDLAVADALVEERRAELTQVEVGAHPEAIRSSEESVEQARIRLAEAEEDLRRGEILFDSGAIAPNELERRRREVETARHALAASEANLAELRTQYRDFDFERSRARLRSAEAEKAAAEAERHLVELRKAELRRAEEAVAEAVAALAIARTNLERTYLRAPGEYSRATLTN